jgi:hypothetical protein
LFGRQNCGKHVIGPSAITDGRASLSSWRSPKIEKSTAVDISRRCGLHRTSSVERVRCCGCCGRPYLARGF